VRREDILRALRELASVLRERNVTGEIYIVGGAAIAVAYSSDRETDDVDAVFRPKEEVRAAALEVARRLGLPDGWLNDAAKGFLPGRPDADAHDIFEAPGLRAMAASPKHLPAMKLPAARSRRDAADIRFLCGLLGIRTVSEALAVALELLTVRTRLILEEVLGPEGGGEDAHGPDFIKAP
jgi:hypothetical protein